MTPKLHLTNKIVTGITFIILGALSYLGSSGTFGLDAVSLFGIALVFYGMFSVYVALSSGERGRLFLFSVVFLVGIILLVKSNFELTDARGLVFVSILFIGGAAFLILFLDNMKEKSLPAAGILLMLLGFLSTNIFKDAGILTTANSIAAFVDDFWPAVLVFLGLSIFLTRKK